MKKFFLSFISLIILFSACKNNDGKESNVQEFKFPDIDIITGLASPISLNPDSTIIYIEDFVPEEAEIKSIETHNALQFSLSDDSLRISLKIISDDLPKLSLLKLNLVGIEYSILLKKSRKIKQKITFDPKGKTYKSVQMKGEMNAWNPGNNNLTLINGIWETEFEAVPGTYQYLFLINGMEKPDPENPEKVSNGMGAYNSVIKIGQDNDDKKPRLSTLSFDNDQINISSVNNVTKLVALYKNYELTEDFISVEDNRFSIIIPADARDIERTYIRVWAYNDYGISNDLLIPLQYGKVINDTEDLTRTDFHTAVLYNTFVDRFFDGDSENNKPTKDKSIHPRANYHGGDIVGITKKIESGYFKKLGINTIWVSPIVKNPKKAFGLYPNPKTTFSAYHGYWPISFTEIDDRFGTEEEFKHLVKVAHENNMNVLLDFIANHVHKDHPVYKEHKDWATNLYLPDGTLNTERWDEYRLTTWFDVFLPSLDLTKPEVYEMLSDSAVWWIEKYDLDGFRHDATKHIPEIFWQTLTKKIKQRIVIPQNRPIYQIGETYGTAELISSYVSTGQLDAQFDFNVYDAAVQSLANNAGFEKFAQVLKTSEKYYGSHHLMGNITGNQDRGRFISYASGSLKFDEDAKLAGWTRFVGVEDSVGYDKCAMLNAIITTIPGLPVIFYGDEIGLAGGNDPDNRKMMRFDDLNYREKELKDITSKLLDIRKKSLPLIYGEMKIIEAGEDLMIYKREYFGKEVIVIINNSKENKKLKIKAEYLNLNADYKSQFGSTVKIENKNLNINIKGNSFDLIMN